MRLLDSLESAVLFAGLQEYVEKAEALNKPRWPEGDEVTLPQVGDNEARLNGLYNDSRGTMIQSTLVVRYIREYVLANYLHYNVKVGDYETPELGLSREDLDELENTSPPDLDLEPWG